MPGFVEGIYVARASSPSYRRTARELAESDLLAGKQSEEVFEVEGGGLRPEALVGTLGSRGPFRKIARSLTRSLAGCRW